MDRLGGDAFYGKAAHPLRIMSGRTPEILGGLGGRASTKPPTPPNSAEWGTLGGDLTGGQEVTNFYVDSFFVPLTNWLPRS
jgi:hypothetical protein